MAINGQVGLSGRSFDAFVSSQRTFNDTDWTAKIQEKYWRARQKFLAKIEKKEDSCIVFSDSKLDAKLQIYRSIDKSCARLISILESYQNALFMYANEENALGILMKECSKLDKTKAGKVLGLTGKSLTQSSLQRIRLYMPLLRMHQEMETFHSRAVDDTAKTVSRMEDKRSQYRASLLWMKNISDRLDPDVYKQLDKFRRVQNQVRNDKKEFDSKKMDVVQKIDLLMASRCNLMNQILASYQAILLETFDKNCNNFKSVQNLIEREDLYDYEFKALKQLNPLRLSEDTDNKNNATTSEIDKSDGGDGDLLNIDDHVEDQNNNNNNNEPIACSSKEQIPIQGAESSLIDVALDVSEVKLESEEPMAELESLFGKGPDITTNEHLSNKQVKLNPKKQDKSSEKAIDRFRSMKPALDVSLLTMDDDEVEKHLVNLFGSSERVKQTENDECCDATSKKMDEIYSKWASNGQKVEESNEQSDTKSDEASANPIDLWLGIDSTRPSSFSDGTKGSGGSIDLLTNELEEIDNSSYFKTLQNLQI